MKSFIPTEGYNDSYSAVPEKLIDIRCFHTPSSAISGLWREIPFAHLTDLIDSRLLLIYSFRTDNGEGRSTGETVFQQKLSN